MDYDPPPAVITAIGGQLERGDLGYSQAASDLPAAYADWQGRHHGWRPDPERIRPFTSALNALEAVLWTCTEPGDGVVVFTPIYHPFLEAIADSGRRRVDVPLDPAGWRIDPDRLEATIDSSTRLMLFCQPHNPTGRVFDAAEIAAIADVADRHDLLVITDEIWGDLTHDRPHRPLADCDERFGGRLVTLGSASKTFNLAGLRCAVAHIDSTRVQRRARRPADPPHRGTERTRRDRNARSLDAMRRVAHGAARRAGRQTGSTGRPSGRRRAAHRVRPARGDLPRLARFPRDRLGRTTPATAC